MSFGVNSQRHHSSPSFFSLASSLFALRIADHYHHHFPFHWTRTWTPFPFGPLWTTRKMQSCVWNSLRASLYISFRGVEWNLSLSFPFLSFRTDFLLVINITSISFLSLLFSGFVNWKMCSSCSSCLHRWIRNCSLHTIEGKVNEKRNWSESQMWRSHTKREEQWIDFVCVSV